MMRRKKGDVSTTWIATIIFLIIGFGILLYFFLNFLWGQRIDRETCHQSVIFRGTIPSTLGAKNFLPLKCKTTKYCITSGFIGGSCNDKGQSFEGEKGITKVKVNSNTDVEKFLSQEILDCWSMMGEGKLSLFTQYFADTYGISGVYPTCVICSRVAFDKKSLDNAGIDLTKIDVIGYMQSHLAPEKQVSYLDYLAGENGKISLADSFSAGTAVDYSQLLPAPDAADVENNKDVINYISAREINFSNDTLSVVFSQITAPSHGEVFQNTLGAAAELMGLAFILKPGAILPSLTTIPPSITTHPPIALPNGKTIIGTFSKGESFLSFPKLINPITKIAGLLAVIGMGAQQINVAWQRSVTAGKCGDVSVGGEARDGCSVVRAVPYDEQSISSYCSVIESTG